MYNLNFTVVWALSRFAEQKPSFSFIFRSARSVFHSVQRACTKLANVRLINICRYNIRSARVCVCVCLYSKCGVYVFDGAVVVPHVALWTIIASANKCHIIEKYSNSKPMWFIWYMRQIRDEWYRRHITYCCSMNFTKVLFFLNLFGKRKREKDGGFLCVQINFQIKFDQVHWIKMASYANWPRCEFWTMRVGCCGHLLRLIYAKT